MSLVVGFARLMIYRRGSRLDVMYGGNEVMDEVSQLIIRSVIVRLLQAADSEGVHFPLLPLQEPEEPFLEQEQLGFQFP